MFVAFEATQAEGLACINVSLLTAYIHTACVPVQYGLHSATAEVDYKEGAVVG